MSSPGPLPTDELLTRVLVEGTEIRDIYSFMTMVRIEREFRLPARITLRFAFPHWLPTGTEPSDFLIKVGKELQVVVGTATVKALVSALEFEQNEDGNIVVVTALDKAHKLGRGARYDAHLKSPINSIVSTIARRNGLQPMVHASYASFATDYLLQVESDFELLNSLADRCGADWWVDAANLHFEPTSIGPPVGTLTLGDNLVSWRLRVTEVPLSTVSVRARNPLDRTLVHGRATAAQVKPRTTSAMLGLARSAPAQAGAVVAQLSMQDNSQADAYAASLMDGAASSSVTGEGVCGGWPTLKPGDRVKLEGCGAASGIYPVNTVMHEQRNGKDWETRFTTGPRTPSGIVDLFGPQHASPSFRHDGLVVGLVTNNRDPEFKGRVKVAFPTLVQNGSRATESDWARIISLGGGKDRGNVSLPEIDDEVLVGFENGNLRHAVVIGGLFGNQASMPSVMPDALGKVPSRAITSRLGHVLEFGDGETPFGQHIKADVTNGPTFRLGVDESTLTLMPQSKLTIRVGESSIVIDSESITISGLTISLQALTEVNVTGATKVAVSSDVELSLSGAAKAGLTGAEIGIQADAMLKMSGAITQVN